MRWIWALGLCTIGTALLAQSPQSVGTIAVKEVVLRAAPKADAPDAGSLFQGVTVVVHHTEGDDWLAIQPPAGAISWINHRYLELKKDGPFPQNAIVHTDGEIKIATGKPGANRPLDARKASLPDGSIVMVIAPGVMVADDQSVWYPIVAPQNDFRYVPRSAITVGTAPIAAFSVKSPTPAKVASNLESMPTLSIPNSTTSTSQLNPNKPSGWPNNYPLWLQAERADQANQYDDAERLYFQLAKETRESGGDAELGNLCYSRIHSLRERRRQGTSAKAETSATWTPPKTETRISDPKNDGWTRRGDEANKAEWTGRGFLRVSSVRFNGRPCYALEDDKGVVRFYAIAGKSDIDLERAMRKPVDLYGVITYPSDMKTGVITVTRIDTLK